MGNRCAVVDDDANVVNVIVANAEVDQLEGFRLIALPDDSPVSTRWVWNGEAFEMSAELAAEVAAAEAAELAAIEAEAESIE